MLFINITLNNTINIILGTNARRKNLSNNSSLYQFLIKDIIKNSIDSIKVLYFFKITPPNKSYITN